MTGALYLARAARDSLGPRVKAAAERYFRQKEKEEEESQTKAFLSRGFEWVEDVFPAVALGCAGLAANNQVPITILSLAFAWILGCRAHRWWLHQADEQDDAALTDVPEKLSRITRLWESLFPSKQSSVIYAHSTYKQDKVLGITGNLNRRADYLSVEEELVGQRLHEEVRQRLDMSGVRRLLAALALRTPKDTVSFALKYLTRSRLTGWPSAGRTRCVHRCVAHHKGWRSRRRNSAPQHELRQPTEPSH